MRPNFKEVWRLAVARLALLNVPRFKKASFYFRNHLHLPVSCLPSGGKVEKREDEAPEKKQKKVDVLQNRSIKHKIKVNKIKQQMIGKKIISVALTVTTGAWLFGASFFVPMASAQSSSDLQAQISALLAQIAALQAQLNSGSGSGSVSFQFTRDLTVGSTGNDVKQLQVFLNSKGFVVASTGAGAPGAESTYFGIKTKAALVRFQAANGVNATGYFGPITRAKIAAMGGVVVPPGGTLPPPGTTAVSLSADNPAASTVVTVQSLADLAHFTFFGNYTVTGVTLKRIGVSADTSLSNVYLFEGDNRLTDAASVSSGSQINFNNPNGLFTVNGQRNIAVKADLNANSGETLGVQLVSFTISGGAAQSVNLSGNLFNVATASLATAALGTVTASGNTDPGNDILLWQSTMTVSIRDVLLKRVAFRQIGSINASDIRNFRLFVDGIQVASQTSLDANGYVTFANVNKALLSGARVIKVLADVVGGSGRTVQLSLRGAYDITVTDTQYNVNPIVTMSGGFPGQAAAFTVNNGTLTIIKATDSPSSNVTLNGSDVSLAKYTFTAYGEPVKVETLKVGVVSTDAAGADNASSSIRNGRILVNGVQYGSTATLKETSYTMNFMVNPGAPATIEVRGDVFDNDGTAAFAAADTLKITLRRGSSNGTPQVSLTPINVPSSDLDANTVTISSGSLSVLKDTNYTNRSVVIPASAYKIADWNITNGNVEDVTLNTLTLTNTASGTFSHADLSDLYIKYGSSQSSVKATPTASDAFSISYTLAKNATLPVEVYATINAGAITTGDAITMNMAVTATTASGQTADVAATPGQQVTGKTAGTITSSLDASSPVSAIVDDSGQVTTLVSKVVSVDDTFTITDVTVTVTDPSAVSSIELLYDGASLGTRPAATGTTFGGLNLALGANATKLFTVRLNMAGVGSGAGATGGAITTGISAMVAKSSNGTTASVLTLPTNGNATYVYKAIPTINRVALSDTVLAPGTKTIAKFSVSSGGSGTIGWKKMIFTVTTSSPSTTIALTAASALWDGTQYVQLSSASTTAGGTVTIIATNEQSISGTVNYELKATVTDTSAAPSSLSTSIARPTTSFAASVAFASVGANSSFVWSDQSASGHSDTTTDWTGDFLVRNLPTDTWTLSK